MDVKTGLFYFFAILLLIAAFRVITARNPVHAVLYLVLAFFQAAALWLLLKVVQTLPRTQLAIRFMQVVQQHCLN